jgi:hypothetical protein
LFAHIVTSIIFIVSLPKISTTLTAILRRPFSHSCCALVSFSERSFLVRKLCQSFSKTKSSVHFSSYSPVASSLTRIIFIAGGAGSRTGVATPQEVKPGYSVVDHSSPVHHALIMPPSLLINNLPGLRPTGSRTGAARVMYPPTLDEFVGVDYN